MCNFCGLFELFCVISHRKLKWIEETVRYRKKGGEKQKKSRERYELKISLPSQTCYKLKHVLALLLPQLAGCPSTVNLTQLPQHSTLSYSAPLSHTTTTTQQSCYSGPLSHTTTMTQHCYAALLVSHNYHNRQLTCFILHIE